MSIAFALQSARRELAQRSSDGLEITLYWNADDGTTTVDVYQSATEELFTIAVPPERALDAFHHPFAQLAAA